MTISAVLLWALLIGGILAVVRYLGRTSQQQPPRSDIPRSTPEQLLAEHFARGEIDEQEYWYHQRLSTLHADTRHITQS